MLSAFVNEKCFLGWVRLSKSFFCIKILRHHEAGSCSMFPSAFYGVIMGVNV
jgi:hypothetical protein